MAIRRSNVVASRGQPRQVSRPAKPASFQTAPMGGSPFGAMSAMPSGVGGGGYDASNYVAALQAAMQRGAQGAQPQMNQKGFGPPRRFGPTQPNLNVPPPGYGGYGTPVGAVGAGTTQARSGPSVQSPNVPPSGYGGYGQPMQGLGMNPSVIQMLLAMMGQQRAMGQQRRGPSIGRGVPFNRYSGSPNQGY